MKYLIDVVSLVENEDGSCSMTIDIENEAILAFAKIGILKVLCDAAEVSGKENSLIPPIITQ